MIAHGASTFTSSAATDTGTDGAGVPYLVMPSGGDVDMGPAQTGSGATLRNGAQVNPQTNQQSHGYDGRGTAYTDAVRAADTVAVLPGDVLVKMSSDPDVTTAEWRRGWGDVGVCHIVAAHPVVPAGHTLFAPAAVGWAGRTPQWQTLDVDAIIAAKVTPNIVNTSGFASMPDVAATLAFLARPAPLLAQNFATSGGDGYESLRPHNWTGSATDPNYAESVAARIEDAIVLMFSTAVTEEQRRSIFIALVRLGIDWDDPFVGANRVLGGNGAHFSDLHGVIQIKRGAFGEAPTDFDLNPGSLTNYFFHTAQTIAEVTTPHNGGSSLAYPESPLPAFARIQTVISSTGTTLTYNPDAEFALAARIGVVGRVEVVRVSDGAAALVTACNPDTFGGNVWTTEEGNPTTLTLATSLAFSPGDTFYYRFTGPLTVGQPDTCISGQSQLIARQWGSYGPSEAQAYTRLHTSLGIQLWAGEVMTTGGLSSDFDAAKAYALLADTGFWPGRSVTNRSDFWNAVKADLEP